MTIFPWEVAQLNMTEVVAALDELLPDETERSLMNTLSKLLGSWTPHPSCAQTADCPPRTSSCTSLPRDTPVVLYCSSSYLHKYGYDDPWHQGAGRYDVLATQYCLNDPTVELLVQRTQTHAFRKCMSRWPKSSASVGAPITLRPPAVDKDPDGVFAALGSGDVPMDAGTLFCLCNTSSKYQHMMDMYEGPASSITWLLIVMAIAPCAMCCLFAAGPFLNNVFYFLQISLPSTGHGRKALTIPYLVDSSAYYEEDLL